VLELGGGSGFQASIIQSWGCHVESIDICENFEMNDRFFPVQKYDGVSIPFDDFEFDRVFSSNVLEHIPHLTPMLAETKRVLKPTGLEIHLVPTPAWRFWTSMARIVFLSVRSVKEQVSRSNTPPGVAANGSNQTGVRNKYSLARLVMGPPHGETGSAVTELYAFSGDRWKRVFRENEFEIVNVMNNRMFYTGYGLVPYLPFEIRRTLSFVLGPACHIFVLKT
jgi:SAM-dependent methyltransferase